jgi:hypothetical protein
MTVHRVLSVVFAALVSVVVVPPAAIGTPGLGPAEASATSRASTVLVRSQDLGGTWLTVKQPGAPEWSPVSGTAPDGSACSGVATAFMTLPWTGDEPWPGYATVTLAKDGRFVLQLARVYRTRSAAGRDYARFLAGARPCRSFTYLTEIGDLAATMTAPKRIRTGPGSRFRYAVTTLEPGQPDGVVSVGRRGRVVVITSVIAPAKVADRATRAALRRAG